MSPAAHSASTLELPILPSMRIDGIAALVTGASRGLGLAAAAALAQAGARVTLAARSLDALEWAGRAIRARGGQCEILQIDVTRPADVEAEIAARGPFQVLVNNASSIARRHWWTRPTKTSTTF